MADARAAAAQRLLDGLVIAEPSASPYGHFTADETIRSLLETTADAFASKAERDAVERHFEANGSAQKRQYYKPSARLYVNFLKARQKQVGALIRGRQDLLAKDFVVRASHKRAFSASTQTDTRSTCSYTVRRRRSRPAWSVPDFLRRRCCMLST